MVMEDPESPSGEVPAEPMFRYRYVGQTPVQTWYPPRYWRPGEVADVVMTIADGQFILTDDPLSNIPDGAPAWEAPAWEAPAWEAPFPDAPAELPDIVAPEADAVVADTEPDQVDETSVSLPPDPFTTAVTPGSEGA